MFFLFLFLFILFVIFIIVLFLYVWYLYDTKKKKDKDIKEGFTQTQKVELKEDEIKRLRNEAAIQSCGALKMEDEALSQEENREDIGMAQDTMQSILNSNRINEWKPDIKDPLFKDLKNNGKIENNTYCYMYNDEENNMKDFTLYNGGCSFDNPLFKDKPFIQNLYETNYQDNTHTLPLKKCVIELDTTKTNLENLKDFWKNWGNSLCSNVTQPLRHDIKETKNMRDNIIEKNDEFNNQIREYRERINNIEKEVETCQQSENQDNIRLNELANLYDEEYRKYTELQTTTGEHRERLLEKENEKNNLEEQFAIYQEKYQEFLPKNESCQASLDECLREKTTLEERQITEQNVWNTKEEEKNRVTKAYNEIKKDYNNLVPKLSNCQANLKDTSIKKDEMIDDYIRVKNMYLSCDSERKVYQNKVDNITNLYQEMQQKEESCVEERNELYEQNAQCKSQKEKCEYLRNEYQRTAQRKQRIREKYRECQNKLEENKTLLKNIEDTNVNLYNELEILIGQNYETEKNIYNAEVQNATEMSNRLMQDYTDHLNNSTQEIINSADYENKGENVKKIKEVENNNAALKYRVEALKNNMCNYCDPSAKQCAERFANDKILCSY